MPGNLDSAVAVGVLPKSLCTAFVETHAFPMLVQPYHDGTQERSLIEDGVNSPTSIRGWKQARKLDATEMAALLAFVEDHEGGLIPFNFYDPYEPVPGQPIGSNWDPTGAASQGRHICVFSGDWSHVMNLGRSEAPIQFTEVG